MKPFNNTIILLIAFLICAGSASSAVDLPGGLALAQGSSTPTRHLAKKGTSTLPQNGGVSQKPVPSP